VDDHQHEERLEADLRIRVAYKAALAKPQTIWQLQSKASPFDREARNVRERFVASERTSGCRRGSGWNLKEA
jgi:tryptophan 2,3-dioxygenase